MVYPLVMAKHTQEELESFVEVKSFLEIESFVEARPKLLSS